MLLDLTENFKVQGSAVIGFWSKKKARFDKCKNIGWRRPEKRE